MRDDDVMIIEPWSWSDGDAISAVVGRLNAALSTGATGHASTARCNITFFKGTDGSFGTLTNYIYMTAGANASNPKILKIMPNSDGTTAGVRICAYSNNGTFIARVGGASDESSNDATTGLYVIFGRKGFGITNGNLPPSPEKAPTYTNAIYVNNDVYDDPIIVSRWVSSAYGNPRLVRVLNPKYPNNTDTATALVTSVRCNDGDYYRTTRGGAGGIVPSEQMIPMQVPSPASSDILTDMCSLGVVTNIPANYCGEIQVTNLLDNQTARYFTEFGYISMRLND